MCNLTEKGRDINIKKNIIIISINSVIIEKQILVLMIIITTRIQSLVCYE